MIDAVTGDTMGKQHSGVGLSIFCGCIAVRTDGYSVGLLASRCY